MLQVKRVDGFDYRAGITELPLLVSLHFSDKMEIARTIDVNVVYFQAVDDEGPSFGFNRSTLTSPKASIDVGPDRTHDILVDALAGEDDHDYVEAGSYDLTIQVVIYKKKENGTFEPVTLAAKTLFTIE
ncbi:hypothetical protein [Lysobacter capsici]|uniref:hypothetical protein n=1 Tax=Lysobacter capsici TaxID=435897 RepID=UPI001C004C69|nr:hypothetical protein [Lysobacter capsici]QWF18444.1 hypothetical protein KME82_06720 [Lysobacter capsici]